MQQQLGFTLIEIMIVVAIVGIIVAIALPSYQNMIKQANENACLSEAKSYGNAVFYSLYSPVQPNIPISLPSMAACVSMTDASGWTVSTASMLYAQPKNSTAYIECDIANGTPCRVIP